MSQLVTFQLTESDQLLLLQIARNSVRSYLSGKATSLAAPASGTLSEAHGIFVSIHKGGELRGCIGNILPSGPLYRAAGECAIAAAVSDPRFLPLNIAELPRVEFEISVLSPMQRVGNVTEIEVGKHGLLISKKGARGLLLPQVAVTYNWDRERFLQETCRKAGLGPDDWKDDGAALQCFSAQVFGERQFHPTVTS